MCFSETISAVQCARCGQVIVNKFRFRGEWYGPECIKSVTGEPIDRWVIRGGEIDEAATAEREARRAAERAERERLAAEDKARRAENAERFAWVAEALRPALRSEHHVQYDENAGRWYVAGGGGFVADAIAGVLNGDNVREWTPRFLEVVREIVAKQAGRRNSRKYDAALDAFDERLGA